MTNINTAIADETSLSERIRLLAQQFSQCEFTGINDPFSMELLCYALNVYADDAAAMEGELRRLRAPQMPAARLRPRPLLHDIIGAVAAEYNISRLALLGDERKAPLCTARHMCWWLAKGLCGMSCRQIGIRMGGRDHSTIISGIRRINAMAARDACLRRHLDKLAERLVAEAAGIRKDAA